MGNVGTTYRAASVFNQLGRTWKGVKSLEQFGLVKDKDWKQGTVSIVLTQKGVNKLTTKVKKEDSRKQTAAAVKKQFKHTFGPLKSIIAKTVLPHAENLQTFVLSAKLKRKKNESDREFTKRICNNFAEKSAGKDGLDNIGALGSIYSLTYSLLYSKFKSLHNYDIKLHADNQNKSGLQLAEELGISKELLAVAETLFNI